MPELTISVPGNHSEHALAEHADLTFTVAADDDNELARQFVTGTVAGAVALLRHLAPGLQPSTGAPGKTTHPASDAAIASYTVGRVHLAPTASKSSFSVVSKTSSVKSSSAVKSSKSGGAVRASTRVVVSFRSVDALERFASYLVIQPGVTVGTVTWSLNPSTARRLRREARTAALGDAYERAWDLAAAGLNMADTPVPPDSPNNGRHAQAISGQMGFKLRQVEVRDTSAADAKSGMVISASVRTLHLDGEPAVDPAALEPPLLGLSAAVEATYSVIVG